MNKEGPERCPGLDVKLINKAVAEVDGNNGGLGRQEDPWSSLIWSDT